MNTPRAPENPPAAPDSRGAPRPAAAEQEPGTNAVEHEPDPSAEPLPDGGHKYVPRSPHRPGNT